MTATARTPAAAASCRSDDPARGWREKAGASRLGCVSALALLAAGALAPGDAAACTTDPDVEGGAVVSVTVECGPEQSAGTFATSGEFFGDVVIIPYEGDGNDVVIISGGQVMPASVNPDPPPSLDGRAASIETLDGNDRFEISAGQVGTPDARVEVRLGAGNDTFIATGGAIYGDILGDDEESTGDDTFTVSGGLIDGMINGGFGSDKFEISGGTITGNLTGGLGVDVVTLRGGVVGGDISAEHVELYGGTVGGDIFALSGSTLIIDDSQSATPLNLQDGVLFSGFDATGTITNTDLAKASGGSFSSQSFSGFSNLALINSTVGFSGSQSIDTLTLSDGSTLYVAGDVTLGAGSESSEGGISSQSHTTPYTDVSVASSSIDLINGSTGDMLQVGDLTLNSARLGLDVDQAGGQADQIFVGGVLMLTGTNIIDVNLIGTPNLGATTEIPILIGGGSPTGDGTFVIQGVSGSLASLFNYQLQPNALGDLVLLVSPGTLSPVTAPKAVDPQTVITALDALDDVVNDAIEFNMGLAGGGGAAGIADAPTIGIFASGQWARVDHEGFDVTQGALSGPGPAFTADDFSAIMSVDFNAAKHFGFDDRYGLNIGLFGGYTSTDVGFNSFLGFPTIGNAFNESGMFGAYGLFRKGFNYVLVSGTSFVGETDVEHGILGTTGSYDTVGYAATATAGRIFVLSETQRFDLRGGILGVTFTGDPYTDSGGNNFGKARVSFGAVKFEPGVYAEHRLQNGMVFSPYARGELQWRLGYRNTGSIEGMAYEFDDSDFSASLSAGFNLKMSPTATVSGEVRGKASTDSTTIAGKIGLKMAF